MCPAIINPRATSSFLRIVSLYLNKSGANRMLVIRPNVFFSTWFNFDSFARVYYPFNKALVLYLVLYQFLFLITLTCPKELVIAIRCYLLIGDLFSLEI